MPYKPGTNPTDPYNMNQESQAQPSAWGNIAYNAAELAAGFVPGVGEAIDLKNAYESYQEGDYLGTGISLASAGIGAVPIAGDLAASGLRSANKLRRATQGSRAHQVALGKDVALSAAPTYELGQEIAAAANPELAPAPVPTLDAFGGAGAPVPAQTAQTEVFHTDDNDNDYTGHGTSFGRQTAIEYGDTTGQGEFGGTPVAQQHDDGDDHNPFGTGTTYDSGVVQREANRTQDAYEEAAFGGSRSNNDNDSGGGGGK